MDDFKDSPVIDILVWQQLQIAAMRQMLFDQGLLNQELHRRRYRALAKTRWIETREVIIETINELQSPETIEKALARIQGFEDDFEARQYGDQPPS